MPFVTVGAVPSVTRSALPSMAALAGWMERMPLLPAMALPPGTATLLVPRVMPASAMVVVRPAVMNCGCTKEPPLTVSVPTCSTTSAAILPATWSVPLSRVRFVLEPRREMAVLPLKAVRSNWLSSLTMPPGRTVKGMLPMTPPTPPAVSWPKTSKPLVLMAPRNSSVLPLFTIVRPV